MSTTAFKKGQRVLWRGAQEGTVQQVRRTVVGPYVDVKFGDKKSGFKTRACRPANLVAL